jgi:L-rhamnose mutarotase
LISVLKLYQSQKYGIFVKVFCLFIIVNFHDFSKKFTKLAAKVIDDQLILFLETSTQLNHGILESHNHFEKL